MKPHLGKKPQEGRKTLEGSKPQEGKKKEEKGRELVFKALFETRSDQLRNKRMDV